MLLEHDEPPASVFALVHERLGILAEYRAFQTPRLSRADPARLFVSTPHRVGMLTRLDAWDRDISFQGWRFLVHDGDDVVAAIHTGIGADGAPRFGHINEGPLVSGTVDAIAWAEGSDVESTGSFEPILVLAPRFATALLFLRHRAGDDGSRALALPPLFTGLPSHELLHPDRVAAGFRQVLQRQAARP